jgi:23S rRNA pseudouridine1911/1915/1917 synthase
MLPTIIYEDDTLLAVNKPSGLVVHADGRTVEPTLSDWVIAHYPHLKDIGGMHTLDTGRYAVRAGILHRLDRETSGIILIAKNDEAFYFLQRQFLDHSIQKTYFAIVEGVLDAKEGVIDLPIGRSRADFRQFTTGDDARGTLRSAVSQFKVLQQGNGFALLELSPQTGRTHQLRVHMKALGHPIVSDTRYGTKEALGIKRVALHAGKLDFTHPNGSKMTLEAPLPPDFEAAKARL